MLRIKLDDVQDVNNLNGDELERHVVFMIANNILGDSIPEIGKVTRDSAINDDFVEDFIRNIIDHLQDLLTSGFITDGAIIDSVRSARVKLHKFSTYNARQRLIPEIIDYLSDDDVQYVY